MPKFIETLGQQAATGGLGAIMGMMMGDWNDERQYNQQERLQGLQIKGQKEMTDYQMMKQLEMWEKTSYGAQREQMIKAGLNPALMYGMGGGGGQSTGSASGNVTGGQAPAGGGELGMGIQMGLQQAMMKAQIENMNADTEKKKVDAAKTAGVDTENVSQDTKNKVAQEAQTLVQTRIARLDERLKGETIEEMIEMVDWQTQKALEEVDMLNRQNVTNKATQNDIIDTVKAEMFGAWIRNAMMKQDIKKSQKEIWKIQAEVEAIIRKGQQDWKSLEIQGQNTEQQGTKLRHDQWVNDIQQSTQLPIDVIEKAIQAIILKQVTTAPGRTPIGGFHQR